jgi:3'-phosphoadenosine 5'-phosphosulfate (PAPS) 3'-phosphatase
VPCGSVGLKAALLAEGRCGVYIAPTPHLSEWDVCAPQALIEAAGGRCTDLLGRPILYNRRDPVLTGGILAATAAIHESLVRALASACRELRWLYEPKDRH